MNETKIYNPADQSKDWLIEHFVVRTQVFEKIFKDLETGKMKYPEQHYLIQGQRGMGKTTLLLRLKYEIENTPKLNSWLIPVFFNEESYDLTSLSNLWEKLLKYLDESWATGGIYYKKTDAFIGKVDYEKRCFELLIQILHTKKKKLVIFFDNFGQLFLDNLNEKEQHRLREILMNCPDIRIIGASAVVMNDLHDYSKPFFEFFKIINLEGLNKDETFQLISKLQQKGEKTIDIEKNKAKIETLAVLTGGVIRTVMLIYEVVLADEDGTALRDLEAILDRITPLYKHRMEDLPAQQRKIVDVIAKKWDAISTKEIAENIRENGQVIPTKLISAQLQQLEKNNVIEKKQTNTKNHLYQVKERFFNIWYLMRNGDRSDKCRVIWLTKFLEIWYDDKQGFETFLKEHILHLRTGKYHPNSAILISEALTNSNKFDVMSLDLLLKETSAILNDSEKKLLPDITKKKIQNAINFYEKKQYLEAIEILNSIVIKDNAINFLLAANYIELNKISDAVKLIKKIKPLNSDDQRKLGALYMGIEDYKRVIRILKDYDGECQGEVFYYVGESYSKLSDEEEAIKYLKKAIALGETKAYELLIILLLNIANIKEAEKYCIDAFDKGLVDIKKILAELYILRPEFNKQKIAKNLINEGLSENKNDPDYHHLMGLFQYFNEKVENREKHLLIANTLYLKNNIDKLNYYSNALLLLNVLVYINKDKMCAMDILNNIKEIEQFSSLLLYKSFICIWDNRFKEGVEILIKLDGTNLELNITNSRLFNEVILLLLSKKQYHSVLKIFDFEKLNLKERLKPTYYVLMYFLKDEYPNEYLKMGNELKQPVEDIIKRIDKMKTEYA